jgi:hypothetical protein
MWSKLIEYLTLLVRNPGGGDGLLVIESRVSRRGAGNLGVRVDMHVAVGPTLLAWTLHAMTG